LTINYNDYSFIDTVLVLVFDYNLKFDQPMEKGNEKQPEK